MRQDVINNTEIFHTLKEELAKAREEIIVVTSWFTDPDLLDILCHKQQLGVQVRVVISDNEENKNTDFQTLQLRGAKLTRIKQNGRGMMHQKFCIIDSNIAIHGSYNWTLNARKKNQESVIVTSHPKTIKELKKVYTDMINMESTQTNGKPTLLGALQRRLNPNRSQKVMDAEQEKEATKPLSNAKEFELILEGLIESEIFKFDKGQILQDGFNRASLTNGDHQTLPNTLDTLYADFIHSLDIAQEKKETLKVKIEELKKSKLNKLHLERDQELHVQESELKARETAIDQAINTNTVQISHHEIEKEKIQNGEIDRLKKQNERLDEEIDNLQVEFVKTRLRWHELIPAILVATIMLAYIIIFYSSAAYILIYSTLDAKMAQMNGIPVVPAEVFDSMAILKAINKGGTAPLFLILFVIIPLGLAISKIFFKKVTIWIGLGIWSLILLVDSLLAYVVAKSIHEVDYLAGKVDETWQFSNFYANENFYLVFVMGALGLAIFKFAYDKIHRSFDERNDDVTRAKNQVIIAQLKSKITKNEQAQQKCELQIADITKSIISIKANNDILNQEKSQLPHLLERKKQFVTKNYGVMISEIEDVVSIYQTKIDNNDLKFSVNALKDRINTFLEGWINHLHDNYSIHKAIKMSSEANLTKNQWFDTKIQLDNKKSL